MESQVLSVPHWHQFLDGKIHTNLLGLQTGHLYFYAINWLHSEFSKYLIRKFGVPRQTSFPVVSRISRDLQDPLGIVMVGEPSPVVLLVWLISQVKFLMLRRIVLFDSGRRVKMGFLQYLPQCLVLAGLYQIRSFVEPSWCL